MKIKIPILVEKLLKKYRTRDLKELADYLNVTIISMPMGLNIAGYYKYINRRKYIFLNSNIDGDYIQKIVLAHELGHAVMHRTENCTFMNGHTLLLTSKIELEANIFAAYLLISDNDIRDFKEFTIEQFANCTGYPEELIKLRLK